MKSDTQFYQIFKKCPNLFAEIVPFDLSAGYRFSSRAYKQVDRTYDGLFEPSDEKAPTLIVEWQVKPEPNIYPRIFMEAGGYQLEEPKRRVKMVLIYPNEACDPKLLPWREFAGQFRLSSRILRSGPSQIGGRPSLVRGLSALCGSKHQSGEDQSEGLVADHSQILIGRR